MTASTLGLPLLHRLVAALVACLASLVVLSTSVASADAAQRQPLAAINVCIKKAEPRKGRIRITQTKRACGRGERPARVVGMQSAGGQKGDQGVPGPAGPAGPVGPQGVKGEQGEQGLQGLKGDDGNQGSPGIPGPEGPAGPVGPQGVQGEQGDQGIQGEKGDPGPEGPAGPQGARGEQGIQGEKGDQGEQGPPGTQGPPGDDGRTVLSGEGAPDSQTGADGDFYVDTDTFEIYGPKLAGAWNTGTSLVGPQGEQGEKGEEGPPGPAGTTLWAVVSAAGTLVRGSGVVAVSGPSSNVFTVEFDDTVSGCAYLSVPGETGTAMPGSEPLGFAVPTGHASNASAVRVKTYDKGGSVADRAFHLTVLC